MTSFGEQLRSQRELRGLTQDQAAELLGVSRVTFTLWEGNKHLPALSRAHELDRALDAAGALELALQQAHSKSPRGIRTAPVTPVHATGPTVATVLKNARRALLDQLCFDDNGNPLGWRHNLVPSVERPSPVSTAYGLGAMALLGGPDANTAHIVERVTRLGSKADGTLDGWRFSAQREPRTEAAAPAINSLQLAGAALPVDEIIEVLRRLYDETSRERPFILTLAAQPLLRVAPDAAFTVGIVRDLLDCRRDFHGVLLWPEKRLHRDQPLLDPSVAHTARAVTVLREAPSELVGDAVTSAEEWLTEQTNLGGVTEIVRRTLDGGEREELAFHQFTATHVVQALSGSERPDTRAITRALRVVWERYDPDTSLWAWGNGDVPVWMLADAVAAVQSAALALMTAPAG
ncbi:MAG: helix-turn-helix domain-containing protein [Actinomycetia bacterium]|nr:helix-turn-helix domain-containing protein [Actinomycetes bacterium]